MQPALADRTPPHSLPDLPYALDALEPHLSAETLSFHYGRHHRGYVDKLNMLVAGTANAALWLEDLILHTSGALQQNAAQAWNHSFYWRCLTPHPSAGPAGPLAKAIDRRFGSFEAFLGQFRKSAIGKFGSGWTWLVKDARGSLQIVNTNDAGNPLSLGQAPLLVCDVWEHAYYIDYRNERAGYVDAFLGLVDWGFVAENHSRAHPAGR